jgi:hypothetical protein
MDAVDWKKLRSGKKTVDGANVFQRWEDPPVLLSKFLDVTNSTPTKRSPTMKAMNKLNLLYVVQSKVDRKNQIFKVGVSRGVGRLNEYVKMHGAPESKKYPQIHPCTGAYLVYLAGQERTDKESKKSAAARENADIEESYKSEWLRWSHSKERGILNELSRHGITPARGREWFQVADKTETILKDAVLKSVGQATKDTLVAEKKMVEDAKLIKADEKLLSVGIGKHGKHVKPLKSDKKGIEGDYFYWFKWKNGQPRTLTTAEKKQHKKGKSIIRENVPYVWESLPETYLEQQLRNDVRPGLGDDTVRMVHKYIEDNNYTSKDKHYDRTRHPDYNQRPKTRSATARNKKK